MTTLANIIRILFP